jgi:TRAP-type C4-dicarboxylate transport system permease small subunit
MSDPDPRGGAAGDEPVFADEPVDLSDQTWDDALVLVLFWTLAFVVFLQFFTRYILNDSIAWTEEIARYFLIAVTFVGSVMAVRKRSHIAVEFLYRWFSRPVRRFLQTVVDLVSVVFYGALAWWSIQLSSRTQQKMVSIDVPKSLIYWGVALCFFAMTFYALRVAWVHWRSGTSRLIDPEKFLQSAPISE